MTYSGPLPSKRVRHDWRGKEAGWVDSPIVSADGKCLGVALSRCELGRGAERVVYELRHFEQQQPGRPDGLIRPLEERLVAKESVYAEDDVLCRDFHQIFCKTQLQASHFARSFNSKVRLLFSQRKWALPATISFLSCYVYELQGRAPDDYWNLLVEKKLEGKWTKWNTNAGFVLGSTHQSGGDDMKMDEKSAVPFSFPAAGGSDSEDEDGLVIQPTGRQAAAAAQPATEHKNAITTSLRLLGSFDGSTISKTVSTSPIISESMIKVFNSFLFSVFRPSPTFRTGSQIVGS